MSQSSLRVLVVDDSAVVRQTVGAILGTQPGWSVMTAADPIFARERMSRARPDVILLDLVMPRMDGLTFLREMMREDPIPTIVFSSHAGRGSETALRALDEGAVEIIGKPSLGTRDFLNESATLLIDAVRAAAGARIGRASKRGQTVAPRAPLRAAQPARLVAFGASAGGTEALREILEAMPADAPPILVVQHMPEQYTRAFAARLDASCQIRVKEAEEGDRVVPGLALIAPGNRHLLLSRSGAELLVKLSDSPRVSRHRPSVDVLFGSVAQVMGADSVGVILTGMGADGARGLLELRRQGGHTIAQDEQTSVVFGMPREAMALGAVEEVRPLGEIASAVLAQAGPMMESGEGNW